METKNRSKFKKIREKETVIINGNKFNIDDINIILINERCWGGGPLAYFISIFEKNHEYDFHETKNKRELQETLADLHKFLKNNNINNFANLGNFLINMDNLENLNHYSNNGGDNMLEAEFENGDEYVLTAGVTERYVRLLKKEYAKQEKEYNNTPSFNID